MASDRMWGGLPFIVPSRTAMKYLYHAKVIAEDEVPVGAHYRAREDMINNVRFLEHTNDQVRSTSCTGRSTNLWTILFRARSTVRSLNSKTKTRHSLKLTIEA